MATVNPRSARLEEVRYVRFPQPLSSVKKSTTPSIVGALGTITAGGMGAAPVGVSLALRQMQIRAAKLPPCHASELDYFATLEAEERLGVPLEELAWRWVTLRPGDGQDEGAEILIASIKRDALDHTMNTFASAGITPDHLCSDAVAFGELVAEEDEQLTMGSTAVTVSVGASGGIVVASGQGGPFYRWIPLGGNSVTRQVAKACNITTNAAEIRKRASLENPRGVGPLDKLRPAFVDLAGEIKRTRGFLQSERGMEQVDRLQFAGADWRFPGLPKYVSMLAFDTSTPPEVFELRDALMGGPGFDSDAFIADPYAFDVAAAVALSRLGAGRVRLNFAAKEGQSDAPATEAWGIDIGDTGAKAVRLSIA